MNLDVYLAFVAASTVLILVPGPNVALIVANSIAHGTRFGLLTVASTTAATAVQVSLTVVGLSALLDAMASGFEYLRWLGVAYLVFLGITAWRTKPADLRPAAARRPDRRRLVTTGIVVSLTNPKTLLFYGAFMPQFVSAEAGDPGRQLLILAATFVALAGTLDACWALLAGRLRSVLDRFGRIRNRVTGGMLIGAALGLALARKP